MKKDESHKHRLKLVHFCTKPILTALLFLISINLIAQNYGDKKFYLIDSLNLDKISASDKELIDTSLTLYHLEKHDTSKLDLIEHIVDECWDENV